jgi:hypothetical protein
MLLEPELLMQTEKKDSEIEDLKSRLKTAADRKSQFQLAIADHEKCEEKVFFNKTNSYNSQYLLRSLKSAELQRSLESIISQTNKVMGLNNFHVNSMRAKHEVNQFLFFIKKIQ